MAIPEGPVDNSATDQSRPTRPSRSRWERFALPALIFVVLGGLALLEGIGFVCHRQSVERIKAWAQSPPPDTKVLLKDLESQMSGSPRRKAFEHQGSLRVIYTWPSVIGSYRLRAQVRQDGKVVYVDTESNEAEDFMTPFLVANEDGVRVVAPGQAPPSHAPPELNVNLLEETRSQFAQAKASRQSGLVIFPVVDDQRAITTTGPALSTIAQFSLIFTPQRRMALSPRVIQQALTDYDCWSPGTILDQSKIDGCLKAIGAETYALPRIQEQDGKWQVQIEVYRSKSEEHVTINRQANALNLVPGEISLGLFKHLKVTLSPAEIKVVAAPQFQQPADAENFTRLVTGTRMTPDQAREFHKQLLEENPQWLAAWRYYLNQGGSSAEYLQLPEVREHPAFAPSLNAQDQSKVGFVKLLKMAPSLLGDVDFHQRLVQMAGGFNDAKLVDELLRIWKVEDNGYATRVARARTLASLGWNAIPPNHVQPPTPEMKQARRKMFEQARAELEQALVLNPQGGEAHAEMIQVAQGLGQPWSQIYAHLENALRTRPGNPLALRYASRSSYRLEPKDAYQFAELCLANGMWQEVPDVLRGAAYDPEKRALDYRQFQSPEHWRLIQEYFRLAQQQQLDPLQLRAAQACFAHDAAIGGHYAEAAPVFDQLDLPFQLPPPPPSVAPNLPPNPDNWVSDPLRYRFESRHRYIQLRDLVRSQTQSGFVAKLTAVRIALAEHRLTDAEQLLKEAIGTNDDETEEIARLGRALAFGHRLAKERRVKLTAQEAYDLFAEVDQQSYRGINRNAAWQVQDDKLISRYDGKSKKPADLLESTIFFPVGLRHGTISGQLDYEGECVTVNLIAHAQALRKPMVLQYRLMSGGKVTLQGYGNKFEGNLGAKPCLFKLNYGAQTDLLSPFPEYQWKVAVIDDSPSTFGLRVAWSNETPASVSLSNLVIELGD